ncbi:MAG: hypothetical protein L0H59_09585 [Tomitella sp.]|nr:hypothetical protein [Tomitella sp.]
MPRTRRVARALTAAAAAAAATAGISVATTATAAAAPPPGIAPLGQNIDIAPTGGCFGSVHVGVDQAPHSDRLTVVLTPTGTYGTPGCGLDIAVNTISGTGEQWQFTHMEGPTSLTFTTGYGLATVNAATGTHPAIGAGYYVAMVP